MPGIGIDLAEPGAYDHLDADAVARAARRWLTPAERAWCAAQPRFREAMVTILSCKESAYKASGGLVPVHELTLRLDGDWRGGWARGAGEPWPVTVRWEVSPAWILTVGASGPEDLARRLLARLTPGRPLLHRRRARKSV